MNLNNLILPFGSRKKRKRVGRGESSGLGKTSGKGGKGQTARKGGGKPRLGFEGGQTPLYRRLPKRGSGNFKIKTTLSETLLVSLSLIDKHYNEGDVVNVDTLLEKGLIKSAKAYKILANGKLTKKISFDPSLNASVSVKAYF